MSQSILSNTVIATTGRLLSATLGFITIGLLTRALGEGGFGYYTLLLSYGALVQLGADFGLYLTLTREIAQQPEHEHHFLMHTLSLRLVLLVLVFSLGGAGVLLIPSLRHLGGAWWIVAVGLGFQSLSQLLMGVYQKYGVVWRATVGDLVGRGVQIAAIAWAVQQGGRLELMVGAFAASTLLALGFHYFLLPVRVRRLSINWPVWKTLVKVSWPLGLMLILNALYFRIDIVILAFFRSPAEVGQYGFAYRLIESGLFFPAMFGGLLLPRLSAAVMAHQLEAARGLLQAGLHFLIVAAALVVVLLLTLPDSLVLFIGGPEFQAAAPLLRILSVALAVMFMGNLFGFTLVALQRQRALLGLYGVLAVVNIAGNVVLIPQWGAVAAAWMTVVTECLAMASAAYLVHRTLPFTLSWAFVGRLFVVVVATVALVVALPATVSVVVQVGLATSLYAVLSFLCGTLRRRHLHLLIT